MKMRLPFFSATLVPILFLTVACGGGAAQSTAAPSSANPTAKAAPAASSAPAASAASPAASAASAAPAASGASAGKTVFDQNCTSCHPNGDKGAGPALRGRNASSDGISKQVRGGGGGMPAFPVSKISDQQLTDLVAYVQSLK